jgi:hypothetical protein
MKGPLDGRGKKRKTLVQEECGQQEEVKRASTVG